MTKEEIGKRLQPIGLCYGVLVDVLFELQRPAITTEQAHEELDRIQGFTRKPRRPDEIRDGTHPDDKHEFPGAGPFATDPLQQQPKPKTRGEEIAEKELRVEYGPSPQLFLGDSAKAYLAIPTDRGCVQPEFRFQLAKLIDAARAEMREQTKNDAVQAIMGATWYEHAGTKAALADRIRALP